MRHANRRGDLASVFLRLEELVLANSGESEFDEIFKLLIAKMVDEKHAEPRSFLVHPTPPQTWDAVCYLLTLASQRWPGIMAGDTRPKLTADHLQVCVQALAPHQLGDGDFSAMDAFFEFLVARTAKGAKGQFFTPRHVTEFCVRMLNPRHTDRIVDPACGSGGFLLHALSYVRDMHGIKGEALVNYAASNLWGFDISSQAVRVAKALLVLAGGSCRQITQRNSLLTDASPLPGEGAASADAWRARRACDAGFDLILTNPPFGGDVREDGLLKTYEMAQGRRRVPRDVLFVERCMQMLKPGGRLAMILPHNKFTALPHAALRAWIMQRAKILAVVSLGRHTFLPHTHQKASILFAQRRRAGEKPDNLEKTFFAISEKDGKNARGQLLLRAGAECGSTWERVDHDLGSIVASYASFVDADLRQGA